jgi:hypothetical protein
MSYVRHGGNSGLAAWKRHRRDVSVDSVLSDFSGMHLGRPGLGDKMFNNAVDLGPLASISASPPESAHKLHVGNRSSFDSIIDDEQRLSQEDSLFEKTHYRSSMSSDSVFGDDYQFQNSLLRPNQFRPISVHSISSVHSPMKEDDTMISVSIIFSISFGYKVNKYYRCSEEDTFVDDPYNLSSKRPLVSALRSGNILSLKEFKFIMARTTPTTPQTSLESYRSPQ